MEEIMAWLKVDLLFYHLPEGTEVNQEQLSIADVLKCSPVEYSELDKETFTVKISWSVNISSTDNLLISYFISGALRMENYTTMELRRSASGWVYYPLYTSALERVKCVVFSTV